MFCKIDLGWLDMRPNSLAISINNRCDTNPLRVSNHEAHFICNIGIHQKCQIISFEILLTGFSRCNRAKGYKLIFGTRIWGIFSWSSTEDNLGSFILIHVYRGICVKLSQRKWENLAKNPFTHSFRNVYWVTLVYQSLF